MSLGLDGSMNAHSHGAGGAAYRWKDSLKEAKENAERSGAYEQAQAANPSSGHAAASKPAADSKPAAEDKSAPANSAAGDDPYAALRENIKSAQSGNNSPQMSTPSANADKFAGGSYKDANGTTQEVKPGNSNGGDKQAPPANEPKDGPKEQPKEQPNQQPEDSAYAGMPRNAGSSPKSEGGSTQHPADDTPFSATSVGDWKPANERYVSGYNPSQQGSAPSTERVDYSQVNTPKDYNYKGYGSGNYTDSIGALNDQKFAGKDGIAKDYAEAVKEAKGTKGDHFTLDGSDKGRDDAYAASVEAAKEAVKKAGARTPEEVSKILKDVGDISLDKKDYEELFADMRDQGSGFEKDAIGAKYAGEGAYVIDGWTNDAIFDPSIIKREIEVNRHCKYLGVPGDMAASGSAMPYTFEGTTAAVQQSVQALLDMREGVIAATEGGESNLKKDFAQVAQTLNQALEYFASGAGLQQITEAMDAPVQAANAAVMGINTEGMGYKQEFAIVAPIIKKLHLAGMNPAGVPGIPPNAAVEELVTAALEAGIAGGSDMDTVLQDAGEIASLTASVIDDSKDFNPDISDATKAKTETSQGEAGDQPKAGGTGGGGAGVGSPVVVGGGGGGGMAPRPVGGGGAVGSNRGGAAGGTAGGAGGRSDAERKSAAEKLADLIAGKDSDKDDKDSKEDKEKKAKDRLDEMLKEKGIDIDDDDDDKDSDDKDSDEKDSDKAAESIKDLAGDIDSGLDPADTENDLGFAHENGPIGDGTAGTSGAGADTGAGAVPGTGSSLGATDGAGNDITGDTGSSFSPEESANAAAQEELGRKLADATHLTGGSADATGLRDNLARSGSGLGSMAMREPAAAGGAGAAGAAGASPAGAMMGAPAGAAGGMSGAGSSAPGSSPAPRVPGATPGAATGAGSAAAAQAQAEAQRKAQAEKLAAEATEQMRESGRQSAEQIHELLNGDIDTGLGDVSAAIPEGGYLNYGEYLEDPFDAEKGDIVASPVGTGIYDGEGNVDLEDGRRIPINQMLQLSPPEYGVFRPESEPAELSATDNDTDSAPKRAMPHFDSSGYASAAAAGGSDPFAAGGASEAPAADAPAAQAAPSAADLGGTTSGSGMGGLSTAPVAPAGDTAMSSGSSDPFANQAAPAPQHESTPAPAPEPQQHQPVAAQPVEHHTATPQQTTHDVRVTVDNTSEGHAVNDGPRNTTGTGFAQEAAASASVSEDRVHERLAAAAGEDSPRAGEHDVRGEADHGADRGHGAGHNAGHDARPGAGDNPESAGRGEKSRPAQEFVAADDRTPNNQPSRPQPKADISGIREVDYEGRPLG